MAGAPSEMVNVTAMLSVPVALVAVTVTEVDPTAVGVPDMTPVPGFKLNPAGNPGAVKLVGLLSAVMA